MNSMLKKLFGFDPRQTCLRTELLAGITTFLTMAYIPAVIPTILGATGMDKGALFTATILASVLATMLMAVYAKLPFVLAPGMGLSAFFAYTVCLTLGYSWQFALTAVLIEGLLFILLTITNLREKIVEAIPGTLKEALCVGIGLFIAFIGLQNAQVIVKNESTLVGMGDITSGPALLSMAGLLIMSVLMIKRVKGALMLGILITTLIGIPMGITTIDGVFSAPPSIEPIFCKFEWDKIFTKDMAIVVFTFLFVDMFDTIGTVVGVATKTGMVDKDGKIKNLKQAFLTDAIGTTAGSMLGTSTVTTTVESTAGIGEGGRSGHGARAGADRHEHDVVGNQHIIHRLFRVDTSVCLHAVHTDGLQHIRRHNAGHDKLRARQHGHGQIPQTYRWHVHPRRHTGLETADVIPPT